MNEQDLIQFLQDHLTIRVESLYGLNQEFKIILLLQGKEISSDYIRVDIAI